MQLPNNELVAGYVADTFELLAEWRALEGLPPLTSVQVASIYEYKGVMALLDEQVQDEYTAEARMHINRVFTAYALSLAREATARADYAMMGALSDTDKQSGKGISRFMTMAAIECGMPATPKDWTDSQRKKMAVVMAEILERNGFICGDKGIVRA